LRTRLSEAIQSMIVEDFTLPANPYDAEQNGRDPTPATTPCWATDETGADCCLIG
jgi:hypothetical protein